MKNATKYLVVGSLGVLMTRRDISSLAVKGLRMISVRMQNVHPHLTYVQKFLTHAPLGQKPRQQCEGFLSNPEREQLTNSDIIKEKSI